MAGITYALVFLALSSIVSAFPQHKLILRNALNNSSGLHPDTGLNVLELITKHGYPVEQHKDIQTDDGYLLEIHRIPHGKTNEGESGKVPVLLMHCLACSSVDWVNVGPNKSLAYKLADLGYDVWLGNIRGNEWGRKHITLDPDVDLEEFWNYSFNELGNYDLPAIIDYVLLTTGAEKTFYVGHSQGTTSFFAMAASRPEYNDKIIMMSALAPVVYSKHVTNPFFQLLAQYEDKIEWMANNIGLYEFLPKSELLATLGREFCNDDSVFQKACAAFLFLLCGDDSDQMDLSLLPVITSNTPSGTSTRSLVHYAQGVKSGKFCKYDYRSEEANMEVYGQPTPPVYDLKNISAPIALYYGANDWMSALVDVYALRDELPNVVVDKKIAHPKFNHVDFLWALDVVDLVYVDVIAKIQEYKNLL